MFELTAILAWGSLTWDPRELDYNKSLGWVYDGPILPIEFARISKDGNLTIVITENGTPVKTFYTFAKTNSSFEEVFENLRIREGKCNRKDIGFYKAETDTFHSEDFPFKEEIRNWSKKKKIKNIIWTNLPEKWEYKDENHETIFVNPNDRIDYLKSLTGEKKELAETYIRKTPIEIQTNYRKLIELELQWLPIIKENKKERYYDISDKNNLKYFSNISGFGTLTCLNCNAKDERYFSWRNEKFELSNSYQCQSCGEFHFLKMDDIVPTCKCGGEFKKDKPIFCRCCDSFKLSYKVKLLS
ncbi:hypothetical protein [Flavobacterium sp.]|uniref:hypothetical protein n=1 Tax=Flavobacterium sp. TaxID=239 RepID=UPI003919813D